MMSPLIPALGLSYAGFFALALTMDRHAESLLGRRLSAATARGLQGLGALALLLSALICGLSWGWSIGVLGCWLGVMTVTAAPLVFLQPYAPALARWLGYLAPLSVPLWGLSALAGGA